MPPENASAPIHSVSGLCQTCQYGRRIESDRGSLFLMCKLSFEDSRFVKYPRLPVWVCSGFRAADGPDKGG